MYKENDSYCLSDSKCRFVFILRFVYSTLLFTVHGVEDENMPRDHLDDGIITTPAVVYCANSVTILPGLQVERHIIECIGVYLLIKMSL